MYIKHSIAVLFLLVVFGILIAAEDYMDSREEMLGKVPLERILEFYRALLQRNTLDNESRSMPLGHLMIRKSQRSPSLRLRFGRSGPHAVGVSSTSVGGEKEPRNWRDFEKDN